ncbi:MAG: 4Fe-4S binding protein [Deltaproteobacteria bacterium]|nr:4Fe-4S binding protein [Deltaproteobacteria bacterium]
MTASWFHPAFVLLALGLAAAGAVWWRASFQRGLQVLSVSLFFALFWLASYGGRPSWPVDAYLLSDPLVALAASVAGRAFVLPLLVSLGFVALAAVLGRVFCSHVCPLGALLDLSDRFVASPTKARANREAFRRARVVKYAVLIIVLVAALAGFELLGFCDPLVLFTRFAATVFYPLAAGIQEAGLGVVRPVGEWFEWTAWAHADLALPSFAGAAGMAVLLVVLLALSRLQPRFWCRHLCPLGGLLAWLGHWAPYRRRVSEACTGCNRCVRECPTGAIHPCGTDADRHECIVCLRCVRTCPEQAVSFGFGPLEKRPAAEAPAEACAQDEPESERARAPLAAPAGSPALSRRGFLASIASGFGGSLALSADLAHPSTRFDPLPSRHGRLIRPPGARPEPDFLARCVRCGECVRACLTNTLQPDWHRAGLEGLWAPYMDLRHAHCEVECNVCGQVCPTRAIRPLSLVEKQHAKVGTAIIRTERCIAWAENRHCLICDEACPYNAICTTRDAAHRVGLPVVDPMRCAGCGTCEDKCPVLGEAAIIVVPNGEIRLASGSYVEEAEALGFDFKGLGRQPDQVFGRPPDAGADGARAPDPGAGEGALPPGIAAEPDTEEDFPDLPPGVSPE